MTGREEVLALLSSIERNKLIFLRRDDLKEKDLEKAEELGRVLSSMSKLGVKTYSIDVKE